MALQTRDREFRHPRISYLDFKLLEMEGATVVFKLDGGKVTGFTFKQGGNAIAFKKIEEK